MTGIETIAPAWIGTITGVASLVWQWRTRARARLQRLQIETRDQFPGVRGEGPALWRCVIGYEAELSGDSLDLSAEVLSPKGAHIANAAGSMDEIEMRHRRLTLRLDDNFGQPGKLHVQIFIAAGGAPTVRLRLTVRRTGSRFWLVRRVVRTAPVDSAARKRTLGQFAEAPSRGTA